jgi:hypothetical protein
MGIILIGLIIALQPVKQKRISDGDEALVKQLEYTTPPDIISGAPDFLKPEASTVPALGPELPGDIGAAMVQPQQLNRVCRGKKENLLTIKPQIRDI